MAALAPTISSPSLEARIRPVATRVAGCFAEAEKLFAACDAFEAGEASRFVHGRDLFVAVESFAGAAEAEFADALLVLARAAADAGQPDCAMLIEDALWELAALFSLGDTMLAGDPDDRNAAIGGLDEARAFLARAAGLIGEAR